MKRTRLIACLAILMLMIIGMDACKHKGQDEPDFDWEYGDTLNGGGGHGNSGARLIISERPLEVIPQPGGQTFMKFVAPADWTIHISEEGQSWIKVSKTEGEKGNHTVTFTISANFKDYERNCAIYLQSGGQTEVITLVQKQVDAMTVSTDKIEIDEREQTFEVEVTSNVDYVYEIAADAQSWISPAISKATTTRKIKFLASANEGFNTREGVIYFKGATIMTEVHVFQSGSKETLVISEKKFHFGYEGGEFKIEIKSNSEYNMIQPNEDWLLLDMEKNNSTYTKYYKVTENLKKTPRSCKILFTSNRSHARDTVYISQDGFVNAMKVTSEKEIKLPNGGGEFTIDVVSNTPYTIQTPNWILGNKRGEVGTVSHKYTVERNKNYEDLVGEIYVTSEDGQIRETIKVTQEKKEDGLNILYYPTYKFGQLGGSDVIRLEASERWVATISEGARTWISTTPGSGESNVTEFDVSLTENNTFSERSGTITITCGQATKDITITQYGIEAVLDIRFGAEGLQINHEGGIVAIQVYSNKEYNISLPQWLKGDTKGAPGTNRHEFTVPFYNGDQDRNGVITLTTTDGSVTRTVNITQDRFVDILEIIDINFLEFLATGSDSQIRFNANRDWSCTVNSEASDWLYLNPREGGKAGKNVDLVVSAMENPLFTRRSGIVTIYCGDKKQVIEYEQEASSPAITILDAQDRYDSDFHANRIKIEVKSNCDLDIETPDWIHGEKWAEKGQKITLYFQVDDNLTYETRSGDIVLKDDSHDLRLSFPVSQSKKYETLKISAEQLTFEKLSPDKTLTITASDPWTAAISDGADAWLKINPAKGNKGVSGMVVSVTQNTDFLPREGEITFTCGREQKVVKVTQNSEIANMAIKSALEIKNMNYRGGEIEVTVSSNCDYDISTPSWISGTDISGLAGENTHTFNVEYNNTDIDRTESIVFGNSLYGVSVQVPVTQNKKSDEVDILDVPDIIISAAGGSIDVKFRTNGNWTISGDAGISFSATEGTEGENTVTATLVANTTPMAISPRFTITNGKASKTVELSQYGEKPYITIQGSKSLSAAKAGDQITIKVKCNNKYTITLPTWITCSDKNGLPGENNHVFTIRENTTGNPRTDEIIFKSISHGASDKATISQE